MGHVCDVQDYKKKMRKEISEYERLKSHLQRLKPAHLDRLAPPQDIHCSLKLKLKTQMNEAEKAQQE
jgi:ribosomal 50S subunit-associated protein YjgA (DUF615 family)